MLFVGLLFLSVTPATGSSKTPYRTAEVCSGHETLSGGRDDWSSLELTVTQHFENNDQVYLRFREVGRFGRSAEELRLGGYVNVARHFQGYLEFQDSPSSDILPENAVSGRLYYSLRNYLRPYVGLSLRNYPSNYVSISSLGLEHYFSNYRLAYTFHRSEGKTDDPANTHQVQFGYYPGSGHRFSAGYSEGQEINFVGPSSTVESDVSSVTVEALYRINQSWSLLMGLGRHVQGDFFTREGGSLGVRYTF